MTKMNIGITSIQIRVLMQHHGKDECWHDFSARTSVNATSWQMQVLIRLHYKDQC